MEKRPIHEVELANRKNTAIHYLFFLIYPSWPWTENCTGFGVAEASDEDDVSDFSLSPEWPLIAKTWNQLILHLTAPFCGQNLIFWHNFSAVSHRPLF